MTLPDLKRIPNISPAWWGAIASAIAAGAFLVPSARVAGGAVAGGALLVLALYKTPCCASCGEAAAAQSTPTAAPTTNYAAFIGTSSAPASAATDLASCTGGCS